MYFADVIIVGSVDIGCALLFLETWLVIFTVST